MTQSLKAVVFDLDGTLIDSAPDLRIAINHLLAAEGRAALDLGGVTLMIGDGARKLVERAFAATGTPAPDGELDALTERFLGFYEGHAADNSRPFPGVIETLTRLQSMGLKMGVCTNKPFAPTMEMLRELGVEPFMTKVVGGDSIPGVRKPDPGMLRAILEGLDATADQALMVGDNANDVASARAAGVPVVVMSYGYTRIPSHELGADRVLDHFADIPAAIAELATGPSATLTA